jgi:hypothetical protein
MTPYTVLLTGYLGLLTAALAVEGFGLAGREPFRPLGHYSSTRGPHASAGGRCGPAGYGSGSTFSMITMKSASPI